MEMELGMDREKRKLLSLLKAYAKEHIIHDNILWRKDKNQIIVDNYWYYICITFQLEKREQLFFVTFSSIVHFLWQVDQMKEFNVDTFEYRVLGYPMGSNGFYWDKNQMMEGEELWEFFCEIRQRIEFYKHYMDIIYENEEHLLVQNDRMDIQWYWNYTLYHWLFSSTNYKNYKNDILDILASERRDNPWLQQCLAREMTKEEYRIMVQEWIMKNRKKNAHFLCEDITYPYNN